MFLFTACFSIQQLVHDDLTQVQRHYCTWSSILWLFFGTITQTVPGMERVQTLYSAGAFRPLTGTLCALD
jgi:hypothetical protein